jgi:hypothetical protein
MSKRENSLPMRMNGLTVKIQNPHNNDKYVKDVHEYLQSVNTFKHSMQGMSFGNS